LSPENQFGPFNRIAQVKSIGATGTIAEYLAEARKLARPNVMSRALISAGRVAMSAATANTQNTSHSRASSREKETMQKTFIILGATLIAAATIQTAAANDRRHVRKAQPVPAPITQSVRDSNAALWPSQRTEPDWSRYSNGAMSAPAGR
jgi:cell division septum initiation protein DivIVA